MPSSPPHLPPELHLYILELAIPPPFSGSWRRRWHYLLNFSLVHRTWAKIVQRARCDSLRLRFPFRNHTRPDVQGRLARAEDKAGSLRHLFVESSGTTFGSADKHASLQELDIMETVLQRCRGLSSLTLLCSAVPAYLDDLPCFAPSLQALEIHDGGLASFRLRDVLPLSLLHLSLPMAIIESLPSSLSHLRTLSLTDTAFSAALEPSLLTSFPSLHTLTLSYRLLPFLPAFRTAPSTLQHLLIHVAQVAALDELHAVARTLHALAAPGLRRVTLAHSQDARSVEEVEAEMRELAAESGVEVVVRQVPLGWTAGAEVW